MTLRTQQGRPARLAQDGALVFWAEPWGGAWLPARPHELPLKSGLGEHPYRSAGVGALTEDILAALAPQIHDLVRQAADESAAAAEAKAEVKIDAASAKARTYIVIAGLAGGALGGLLGWALARR